MREASGPAPGDPYDPPLHIGAGARLGRAPLQALPEPAAEPEHPGHAASEGRNGQELGFTDLVDEPAHPFNCLTPFTKGARERRMTDSWQEKDQERASLVDEGEAMDEALKTGAPSRDHGGSSLLAIRILQGGTVRPELLSKPPPRSGPDTWRFLLDSARGRG
jgi:hypothetical protein